MLIDPVVETAYLGFPFCIQRELNLSDLMFKEGCLILCSCMEKMIKYLWECKDTVCWRLDREGLQSLGSVTTSSGPGSLRHTGAMGVDKDCEADDQYC